MTVDLIKENGIIQEVVINKAEYFDNNTWDKTAIAITSDMQKVIDEIIMIYDETAFGEPEPRCNSIYDYYGVGGIGNSVSGIDYTPLTMLIKENKMGVSTKVFVNFKDFSQANLHVVRVIVRIL